MRCFEKRRMDAKVSSLPRFTDVHLHPEFRVLQVSTAGVFVSTSENVMSFKAPYLRNLSPAVPRSSPSSLRFPHDRSSG